MAEPCSTRVAAEQISAAAHAVNPAEAINKITVGSKLRKVDKAAFEVFTNSVLSGPITHAVNITSNATLVLWSPTTSLLEGMSAAARGDFDKARMNGMEAIAKFKGIGKGISDILRYISLQNDWQNANRIAKKAGEDMDARLLNNPRPELTDLGLPTELLNSHELARRHLAKSISSETIGSQGPLGSVVDFLGSLIRIPGAALIAEDKAFKAIHYRMEVNAAAVRSAHRNGTDAATRASLYNTYRNSPPERLSEATKKKATEMAEYYTFTNKLGTVGSDIHRVIHSLPFARYMVPFFQTPTNIVKMGIRNSVFGNVFMDLKPALDYRKGADRAAMDAARAKIAMGTILPTAVLMNMDFERITGRIDQTTPEGRFKVDQGLPEYSIKLGDEWFSYEKIEPFRSIVGLMVNYKEALNNLSEFDENGEPNEVFDQIVSTVLAPFIQTPGDNYMLYAMGQTMHLLDGVASGNKDYGMKVLQRVGVSMLTPNMLRQFNKTYLDSTYRRADGFIDQLKQGWVPGYSSTMPASMTSYGDERIHPEHLGPDIVSPIATRTVELDDFDREQFRLKVNIPREPKAITMNGINVKLTPLQRQTFSVLRGKGVGGGPTLKESIVEVMSSPMFAALPDFNKKAILDSMWSRATSSAKSYLFATDYELRKEYDRKFEQRILFRNNQ